MRNMRSLIVELKALSDMDEDEVFTFLKKIRAHYDLVAQMKKKSRLPIVHSATEGIVTLVGATLMM
ncbi:Pyridoxal 5-phosphate synthase subunit PdxS/SNZ [Sesbania bispinosa]|nr:Pyridoxal 5-phosphate synthase subunit PdxS/SNZ [Sesbania bispinosa]